MEIPRYLVRRAASPPALDGNWDAPAWSHAGIIEVDRFHPRSAPGHRPRTQARLLHDPTHLHVIFRVQDRYVRCVNVGDQARVFCDSCVELFIQPQPDQRPDYLNFEMSCGGSLLLFHVERATGNPDKPVEHFERLPPALLRTIERYHSLPQRVDPEITEPVEWRLQYAIPLALIEQRFGPLAPPEHRRWRANLYKCGDETSHPHWASWSPLEVLNNHQPERFGKLEFEQ